jgi:hypothetical protein
LSLGVATTAGAQERERVRKEQPPRQRVTKEPAPEPPPPPPPPAPEPPPPPPPPPAPEPPPPPPPPAPEPPPPPPPAPVVEERTGLFGNGVYLGLAGGVNIPRGGIARRVYDSPGIHVMGNIGFDPANFPIGLRLDVTYDRFRGQDFGRTNVTNPEDANSFAGMLNAKFRLPFGGRRGPSGNGIYVIGGGNFHRLGNAETITALARSTTNDTGIEVEESVNAFGVNGGAGIAFSVGTAQLFLESRYVRVFTEGRNFDYAPVVLGINFF